MAAPVESTVQAARSSVVPNEVSTGIDPDAEFRVCVQFSQYIAKLDDGSFVHVPRKYEEWVVDYRECTLERLVKDFAAKINWGRCQQVVVCGYDTGTGEETKFTDNMDLVHAFFVRKSERRLVLFVDVVDKPVQLVTSSSVSEINGTVMDEVVTARHADATDCNSQHAIDWESLEIAPIPTEQVQQHVIDWDGVEITPIAETQIGSSMPVMDEDEMYAFVGLRAEDERAEQARLEAEKQLDSAPSPAAGHAQGNLDNEADIGVSDVVPGESEVFYDRNDPPMITGSSYLSMVEFRSAVRQHAIKGQFELGTESSDKERFRGFCKAEGCPWAIVARLMPDEKSVRVLTTNLDLYRPLNSCLFLIIVAWY
jgi:hypothetical protein